MGRTYDALKSEERKNKGKAYREGPSIASRKLGKGEPERKFFPWRLRKSETSLVVQQ